MRHWILLLFLTTGFVTVASGLPTGVTTALATTLPSDAEMPTDEFGQMVRKGQLIFSETGKYARAYVGNDLSCQNCHLDKGRKAGAAPLWAAYLSYPAYRAKNHHVNTFAERLQECFRFSMNGKAPPLGDPVLVALESYASWMGRNATSRLVLPERGFPEIQKPDQGISQERGKTLYVAHCASCHGLDGEGEKKSDGTVVIPPLWGMRSFNWGAGMARIDHAAAFIKANMPLGTAGTLSTQEAWDVAAFVDAHERPQDPRYSLSVENTRILYHNTPYSWYGRMVEGHVLGDQPAASLGLPLAP